MNRYTVLVAIAIVLAAAMHSGSSADPWPHRKPGLWQMTMTMQGSPMGPMTSKYCIDAATEAVLMQMGQSTANKMCSSETVHVAGSTGTIDAVCRFGKTTSTSHTTVTFLGDTAYRSETHSHLDPPSKFMKGDRIMTNDARWVGSCPAGMKPGDIDTADGMRMHMNASCP